MNREILCLCLDYPTVDARSFRFLAEVIEKFGTRLDPDSAFIVSDAENLSAMAEEQMEQTGRKLISFSWRDVEGAGDDYAYEVLREFLYSKDFFDVSNPVTSDGQFFARYKFIDELYDGLRAGQSMGVFGLRRIGKTSVLGRLALKNELQPRSKFTIARVDAQKPHIYQADACGVILEICREFNSSWAAVYGSPFKKDIPRSESLVEASRYGSQFLQTLVAQGRPLLLVIDELERILPNSNRLSHWNEDYLALWRFLRAESQTTKGRFVFLVASTNPYFVEEAAFNGEDNPLHGFVRPRYLPLFTVDELSDMLRKLGKPMGVEFEDAALRRVHFEYGGHPWISRQFCSFVACELRDRPLSLNEARVDKSIERYQGELRDKIDSILKVLTDYYPDEYQLFEKFSRDERGALRDLENRPAAARHLLGYGLIRQTKNSYQFSMNALGYYFRTLPPQKFRQPDIPDKAVERHIKLQALLNDLEPELRSLVMIELRNKCGAGWQAEVLRHLNDDTRLRLEALGPTTGRKLMEEAHFPELLQMISANWSSFSKTFSDRSEFKSMVKHAEAARRMADHRRRLECLEDAKYIPALTALEWFAAKLLE